MIKAKIGNTVIFGLSDENMTRLSCGEPISFNLKELGLDDIEVFIFSGKNEDIMKRDMKEKIHPYLTTIIDKRAGNKN